MKPRHLAVGEIASYYIEVGLIGLNVPFFSIQIFK